MFCNCLLTLKQQMDKRGRNNQKLNIMAMVSLDLHVNSNVYLFISIITYIWISTIIGVCVQHVENP